MRFGGQLALPLKNFNKKRLSLSNSLFLKHSTYPFNQVHIAQHKKAPIVVASSYEGGVL